MNNYDPSIPILREMLGFSIINKLNECGFEELENPRAALGLSRPDMAEKVFVRDVTDDGRMRVKVYTAVFGGIDNTPLQARSEGKDAIRVCATYTSKNGNDRGIVKETRINRVGNIEDIVDRMYQRMRSAYKSAKTGDTCQDCGAPKFTTKKGNTCCAEICWKSDEEKAKDEALWNGKKRGRAGWTRSRGRFYRRF